MYLFINFSQQEGPCLRRVCGERRCWSSVWRSSPLITRLSHPRPPLSRGTVPPRAVSCAPTWAPPPAPWPKPAARRPSGTACMWAAAPARVWWSLRRAARPSSQTLPKRFLWEPSDPACVSAWAARADRLHLRAFSLTRALLHPPPPPPARTSSRRRLTRSVLERRRRLTLWRLTLLMIKVCTGDALPPSCFFLFLSVSLPSSRSLPAVCVFRVSSGCVHILSVIRHSWFCFSCCLMFWCHEVRVSLDSFHRLMTLLHSY